MAKKGKKKEPGSYRHDSAERVNQPTSETAPLMAPDKRASTGFRVDLRDTGLDAEEATTDRTREPEPRLAWDRKGRTTEDDQPVGFGGRPLYIREKVHPLAMIDQLRKPDIDSEMSLFDDFNGLPEDAKKWEFYQHTGNWQNRLIHGDSSDVMQSLIARDGLAGQVQMIYFDPPYGISFKSNFMTATDRMETKDGLEGVPVGDTAPVKAFRDTYERGIHSYLDGIHERLVLFRELLKESGSLFLQIGDENVHRLAVLCDEVFGPENRVATITWRPTGGSSAKTLPESASYLLWYAKEKTQVKYYQLYEKQTRRDLLDMWTWAAVVEQSDGSIRNLTQDERMDPGAHLNPGDRLLKRMPLTSQGASRTGRTGYFEFEGVRYHSGANRHWRVSTPEERTRTIGGENEIATGASSPSEGKDTGISGLERLVELNRLHGTGEKGALSWKWYENEVAGRRIDNVWYQLSQTRSKRYVVQTANPTIERCILMSTDPGDIVLDPTCGSGVTAQMAEEWGRRWITIDVGRVAIAIARRHLLTTTHPWYKTLDGGSDPAVGLEVETIQKVTAATLAYDLVDEPENTIFLVDRPKRDGTRWRMTGPFTVESSSPYSYMPFAEENANGQDPPPQIAQGEDQDRLLEALRGHTVHDANGRPVFTVEEPVAWPEGRLVGWEADCSVPERERGLTAAVMIAPLDVTVTSGLATDAVTEALSTRSDIEHLIIVAHAFEDSAVGGMKGTVMVYPVQPSKDLLIPGLAKKEPDAGAFTLLGEPDVECRWADPDHTLLQVTLQGFDTYDPATGQVRSSRPGDVDCWMVDTDHDRASFFPRLVYLPAYHLGHRQIKNLLKSLGRDLDPEAKQALCGTESQPFPPPEPGHAIAVKIITRAGAEMTTILQPPPS